MKIAFTLCSNNYLAQAKTLGDSLINHNPEYKFIIGLVDKKSPLIDYSIFKPHEIVLISEIGIMDFDELWKKYEIIELNTAVKPSFFKYLFSIYSESAFVIYFDPDILIFCSLTILEKEFDSADILLTPHVISPIPLDIYEPTENTFLNYGIYNLGFAGFKNHSHISNAALDWWELRTFNVGFIDESNGIFVDQLWMNLAPVYFEKVAILKALGYNAAPWNLHERKDIVRSGENYIMSDHSVLTFFHFSSYSYKNPEKLSKYYSRYNFQNCPDLKPLYDIYLESMKKNNIKFFSEITCAYITDRKVFLEAKRKEEGKLVATKYAIKRILEMSIPPILITGIRKFFK